MKFNHPVVLHLFFLLEIYLFALIFSSIYIICYVDVLCVSLRVKININDIVSPLLSLYEEQAILRNSYAVNRGLNKLHFRTVNTMDNTIWRNFSDTAVRTWQFKLH